jgi:DNA-binding SARP family transcriptional activator
MPLTFRLLGPLEVTSGSRPLHIGSSRQRTLLATLLLRANNIVGVDELVEAVWGEAAPIHPRAALQTCVTRLRNAIGDLAIIEARPDGYRIAVDADQVDLCRFDAAVLAAKAAGDREAEVLGEALSLWRGEPLAGVRSDFLDRREVPRLVERRLQVLERRLELDLNDAAVGELQELTARYPLRERFWALLMIALSRSGRQADALEAYVTVRERLMAELGVEPGQDLRQAHQKVLMGSRLRLPWSVSVPWTSTISPAGTRSWTGCGECSRRGTRCR